MSGICIAKFKNEKLPTEEQLNNCLTYSSFFGFAYNKNGMIYIHRKVEKIEDYFKIILEENIGNECGMIFKFVAYANKDDKRTQPFIVCNNYNEMVTTCTNKPVMVFHDEVIGFDDGKEDFINNQMKFCKLASMFDRNKNFELFDLSLGDNLSAMLHRNGRIDLFGLEKHDKWENVGNVFFSDNDYKTYSYNVYNYQQQYGNQYCYQEDKFENNFFNEDDMICEECHKKSESLTYFDGQMLCEKCIEKKYFGFDKSKDDYPIICM